MSARLVRSGPRGKERRDSCGPACSGVAKSITKPIRKSTRSQGERRITSIELSTASDLTPARYFALHGLLANVASTGGSDLFLKTGAPSAINVHGRIEPTAFPILHDEDTRRLAFEEMRDDQESHFERECELNLSFMVPNVTQIRQNVYQQRTTMATTCRLIPLKVKSLGELGIESKEINGLTETDNGLEVMTACRCHCAAWFRESSFVRRMAPGESRPRKSWW